MGRPDSSEIGHEQASDGYGLSPQKLTARPTTTSGRWQWTRNFGQTRISEQTGVNSM